MFVTRCQDANSELEKKLKEARPYQLMSELKQQQQQQQQQEEEDHHDVHKQLRQRQPSSQQFNLSTIAEAPLQDSAFDGNDRPLNMRLMCDV